MVVGSSAGRGILSYQGMGSQGFPYDTYGIGETVDKQGFAALDGLAIYQFALTEVPGFISRFLERAGTTLAEIDLLIPHQPNPRMLEGLRRELNLPQEKVAISCDRLGNMIGASIPITYHLARKNGRISKGAKVLFCSFGDSYLTAAAILFKED